MPGTENTGQWQCELPLQQRDMCDIVTACNIHNVLLQRDSIKLCFKHIVTMTYYNVNTHVTKCNTL